MTGPDLAGNDSSEILEQPASVPLTEAAEQSSTNSNQAADYNEQLKQDFQRMFDLLTLTPVQKEFLRARWLDQVLWMEKKAMTCRDRHFRLRMVTIIGSVIIPVLITLGTITEGRIEKAFQFAAVIGSAGVAACSAIEGFFSYGRQWYSYRQSVESLKSQGWQFFQLSGAYSAYARSGGHKEAFLVFAAQVEELIQRDVELYVTQLNQQQAQQQEQEQAMLQKLRELNTPSSIPDSPQPN